MKKFWNMQIFGHKKLSFLTKITHFLAYFKYLLYRRSSLLKQGSPEGTVAQ